MNNLKFVKYANSDFCRDIFHIVDKVFFPNRAVTAQEFNNVKLSLKVVDQAMDSTIEYLISYINEQFK